MRRRIDLLLVRPGSQAGLLLEVHGAPLDLVDDLVDTGAMRRGGRGPVEGLTVDHQRDVDDVGALGAPMPLQRQLHDRVAPVVQ